MNPLRRFRLALGLSQTQFAARLGVAEQTYRTWDSGRRTPPRSIVAKARRLVETDGGRLLPLQHLADECGIHVRTLRKAALDGRLAATFSARMAFGKLVAFASREAVEAFKRKYYRQTTQWNRPARPAVCIAPHDYDQILVSVRTRLRLTQTALAERVGAANKAVVYQWESRRRRPSPIFWKRVRELAGADTVIQPVEDPARPPDVDNRSGPPPDLRSIQRPRAVSPANVLTQKGLGV